MVVVRIERNGRGFFRPSNKKIYKLGWYNEIMCRHRDFNIPREDGLDLTQDNKEWFCAYKCLDDLDNWVTEEEVQRLINYGFRVYLITVSEFQEGDHQVIFTKEGILEKQDITDSYETSVQRRDINSN